MNRFKLTKVAGVLVSIAAAPGAFAQATGAGATDYATTALGALNGLGGVFGTIFAGTITISGAIVLGMVAWKYMKKLGNKV